MPALAALLLDRAGARRNNERLCALIFRHDIESQLNRHAWPPIMLATDQLFTPFVLLFLPRSRDERLDDTSVVKYAGDVESADEM